MTGQIQTPFSPRGVVQLQRRPSQSCGAYIKANKLIHSRENKRNASTACGCWNFGSSNVYIVIALLSSSTVPVMCRVHGIIDLLHVPDYFLHPHKRCATEKMMLFFWTWTIWPINEGLILTCEKYAKPEIWRWWLECKGLFKVFSKSFSTIMTFFLGEVTLWTVSSAHSCMVSFSTLARRLIINTTT